MDRTTRLLIIILILFVLSEMPQARVFYLILQCFILSCGVLSYHIRPYLSSDDQMF